MKIAIVAPSPVPFCLGGAENLWKGLLEALNARSGTEADLIKLPSPERNAQEIVASYRIFSELDLRHFDRIISTKYPAWMVAHPNHVVYLQHKLRGLYDTYPANLSCELSPLPGVPGDLLRLLEMSHPDRVLLPELFELLTALYADEASLPPETRDAVLALPGAFLRRVVHQLDSIALSPREIRRYFAIARTVVDRADYFPDGVDVEVLHHPTTLAGLRCGDASSIFTASRLDGPKRIDLLIRAYLRSGVSLPLRIAGDGPQAGDLRRLAGDAPGIRFLGRISDADLASEYATAAFVPFVPDREDYGLITVEAMLAGKPVLTTLDAGGATELVRHQINGLCVEPVEDVLADAIRQLCDSPEVTRRYGMQARESVSGIRWSRIVDRLLADADRIRKRPRLLVANTFPIYPPRSGGQHRVYQLCRHLARDWAVTIVSLCPAECVAESFTLPAGIDEIRVPRSARMQAEEAVLDEILGISSGDLAAMFFPESNLPWLMCLRDQAAKSDVIIASHPYSWPALRLVWRGPIHLDAHNVEYDLKFPHLEDVPEYLERLDRIEGECAREAATVFACSEQDADRLSERYGLARRPVVVPNGVDTRQIRPAAADEKASLRKRLGIPKDTGYVALFAGSDHPPNREALSILVACAVENPADWFIVLGSVAAGLPQELPPNLIVAGVVSEAEKLVYFHLADIALNPMRSGSGTNLKLLDYAAAGLPILTTPFGARGGVLGDDHLWFAEAEQFPAAVHALLDEDPVERAGRVARARRAVEERGDWRAIAVRLDRALRPQGPRGELDENSLM